MSLEGLAMIGYRRRQRFVLCNLELRQIEELVDARDVDAYRAGCAVSAVGAESGDRMLGRGGKHARIVALSGAGIPIGRALPHMAGVRISYRHRCNRRSCERIMQALDGRYRVPPPSPEHLKNPQGDDPAGSKSSSVNDTAPYNCT